MSDFSCLILADGKGSRFGGEKQFARARGGMLWEIVYKTIFDLTDSRIVVGIDIPGGDTRQSSVKAGLSHLDTSRTIIIDVCRPFLTQDDILYLLSFPGPSVTYGTPLEASIYGDSRYLDIRNSSLLSNPQCFDTRILKEAHERTTLVDALDDTSVIFEVFGIKPTIVKPKNTFNLTPIIYKQDLELLDLVA